MQLKIRPGITMSKMGSTKPKKEPSITNDSFSLRKLDLYSQYYSAFYSFRKKRERASRYKNGDQWFELVRDEDGNWISEAEAITKDGQIPLVQNIIKPAIRSLIGQFRSDASKSIVVSRTPNKGKEAEMLSNALQYNLCSINNSKELDARAVEELLTSGLIVQKIYRERKTTLKRKEVKLKNVDDNAIFFNPDARDIRGDDITVIGELMDFTLDRLILEFATSKDGVYSAKREQELRDIYGSAYDYFINTTALDPNRATYSDFYVPSDPNKCRVIDVWEERVSKVMEVHDWMNGKRYETDWSKSDIARINEFRAQKYKEAGFSAEDTPICEGKEISVTKWFHTCYSPYGHVLREEETPFSHAGHPYVILAYPLQDGNITGLVSDEIDVQRQVNRLVIQQDMILKSSIKNTLFLPEGSHDGKSTEDISYEMKKIGGVIDLNLDKNRTHPPFELGGSKSNMGIANMIEFNLRMNDSISGVNPAMQGQKPTAGTSGKLYDAQRSQSTLNSKDIMDSFTGAFRAKRDMKLLQTIQQFYDEPRMLAIAGKSYTETAQLYDPEAVRDVQFDLTIGQTADSPVYRDIINDRLFDLLMKDKIDTEVYFENTTDPFSSNILESLRSRKEEMNDAQNSQQNTGSAVPAQIGNGQQNNK